MPGSPYESSLYELLMALRRGGCIVSTAECSAEEIAVARAERRLHVDLGGFGYLYRPTKGSP